MGPRRRRRWRRRALQAALAALGSALLVLVASGGGEEALAAALAAWGEGRGDGEDWGDGGEWGMGDEEPPGGIWGGGVMNGGRGKEAGFMNGERGKGAGLGGRKREWGGGGEKGWGVLNGSSGVTNWGLGGRFGGPEGEFGGPGGRFGGPGGKFGGPGGRFGGPESKFGGPEGEFGGPGGRFGDPGGRFGGPEGEFGGPGTGFKDPKDKFGGPGDGFGGPGTGFKDPKDKSGGPGGKFEGPKGEFGGPGGKFGGPKDEFGGPGGEFGDPKDKFGGPEGEFGDPQPNLASPRVPPGCSGLLSGGSGHLPGSPPTPRLLLAPPPCQAPPPYLLILVPSAPPHLERRLAVRHTWGGPWPSSPSSPSTRTIFVLGSPSSSSSSSSAQRRLLDESRQHGDILQGDFLDTYAALSVKTALLLRWALSCCPSASFLLKADDDVFVNVPAVATYLKSWREIPRRLYLGRVHWNVAPDRDPRSRHFVPEEVYPESRYPPYCSGTAYVLSRQAAGAVLRGGAGVGVALPEDVWVGLSARRGGVYPRHAARFGGAGRGARGRCCLEGALFSAHRVGPPEMRRVWGRIRESTQGCGGFWGSGVAGVVRCKVMEWGEWLWGGGGGVGE